MTLDESKKLLADMYDALNAQDLEAQHKYWHDNMVWHGPPGFGDIHGIENFKYKVLKPFMRHFQIIMLKMILSLLKVSG